MHSPTTAWSATGASPTSSASRPCPCTTALSMCSSSSKSSWPRSKRSPSARMIDSGSRQGVNIIGAGLAGSLLAVLLAKRGFQVDVYERRRDPRLGPVDSGRSINLALASRGIRGLKLAGVLERVMPLAIPMRGRMVHEHDGSAELQMYGVRPEEVIYSVSRADLNRALIEAAAQLPGVTLHFGQLCLGLAHGRNVLELRDEASGRIHHA